MASQGEYTNAGFDGLARMRLGQGHLDDCAQLLDRIDQSIRAPKDRLLYAHRYALLTRSELLGRQGMLNDALAHVDSVLALAGEAGDHLLFNMAQLTKAELLQQANRIPESLTLLESVVDNLASQPPDLYAQYERILACGLALTGDIDAARLHRERAERVYASLRHAPGLIELSRCWDAATNAAVDGQPDRRPPAETPANDHARRAARSILETAAALVLHAGRPELLAHGVIDLLDKTGAVHHATAVSRTSDGRCDVLASTGEPPKPDTPPDATERRMAIGSARDCAIEITVRPKNNIESVATFNAIKLLLATIHDIEGARAEREERMTLWPIDDVTTAAGHAVVTGRMRELMSFAKRIATTNVSVLITGESGTGKEILARAIHTYSDRSQKPFIPFNCSAIPREMLESQLFGHRRGAFTGADRDNPGIIRSARDGTLFLDEIGELGLDLQPKLLRFLESGEICPLGESTPFTVDVRVVAATNSNLEHGVKEGRFREDLFYRLNVIRLQIPPLRERRDEIPSLVNYFVLRAAEEFRKGQLRFAEETMEHLLLCPWPGNIRQLHNEIRRMAALAEPNAVLTPAALSDEIMSARPAPRASSNGLELAVPLNNKLLPTLSRIEREMIKVALHEHRGKVDAAARALGISRKGLYLKRQRLGL
jgi:DNA-binding NtrC family response regulator